MRSKVNARVKLRDAGSRKRDRLDDRPRRRLRASAKTPGSPICFGAPKSGPGQSGRFDLAPIISGLPREADYFSAGWHVSNVPRAEVTNPGNHRIKRGEQSGQSCPGNWLYAAIVELLKAEGRAPNFVPY